MRSINVNSFRRAYTAAEDNCRNEFNTSVLPKIDTLQDSIDTLVIMIDKAVRKEANGLDIHSTEGAIAILIMRFLTSHFVIIDLLNKGHYLESKILVRAEVEVLSRIREFMEKGYQKANNKMPNIKHSLGDNFKDLYEALSRIAHPKDHETALLHIPATNNGERREIGILPVFSEEDGQATLLTYFIICRYIGYLTLIFLDRQSAEKIDVNDILHHIENVIDPELHSKEKCILSALQ